MTLGDGRELIRPHDRAEWRAWLERHHATSDGVWLAVAKKDAKRPGPSYEEAVEEALAFGWIDSKTTKLDEDATRQLFTPRRRGGTWARTNKERVERLIAEGRMTPAGMAVIDAAKADGSWSALDEIDALVVPPDLARALAAVPSAERHFAGFTDGQKKMVLGWVTQAKRPETRARRVAETVRCAAEGKRPVG